MLCKNTNVISVSPKLLDHSNLMFHTVTQYMIMPELTNKICI